MKSTLQLLKAILLLLFTCIIINKTYSQSGTLDLSFGNGGQIIDSIAGTNAISRIGIQKDGKIIVGYIHRNDISGFSHTIIIKRYTKKGIPDSSFGSNGATSFVQSYQTTQSENLCMAIDTKDRILCGLIAEEQIAQTAYFNTNFLIKRLTENGTMDYSFGKNGSDTIDCTNNPLFTTHNSNIRCIVPDGLGNIFVTGDYTPNISKKEGDYFCLPVAKIKDNGSLDSSFGINGKTLIPLIKLKMYPDNMVLQPDGKIVIGSYLMRQSNIKPFNWGLYRFNTNGLLDSTFGKDGVAITNFPGDYAQLRGLTILNNKIVACGDGSDITNTKNKMLEQYNNIGHLNKKFEQTVAAIPGTHGIQFVKTTTNNKLIGLDYLQNILKFNSNGTLDSSFGTDGIANIFIEHNFQFTDMLLQTDNKVLITGLYEYDLTTNTGRILVARYNNDTTNYFAKISSAKNSQLEKTNIRIFPNPANNYIDIDGLKQNSLANILIIDAKGKTVLTAQITSASNKINIQNLSSGIYYIAIIQDGKTIKQKFIKQ